MSCVTDIPIIPITIKQGGNKFIGLTIIYKATGLPVDITGYVFKAEIRAQPDGDVIATFSYTLTSPTDGKVLLSLDSLVTADIIPGPYLYDVKMTRLDSVVIYVIDTSSADVEARITT